MKSIVPFIVNYSPIQKLVLIPFEKDLDKLYSCLELQEIIDNGKVGYRVVAYRVDEYVDVYDDYSVSFDENEKFDVTQKGLNKHVQTEIKNIRFEKVNNCEVISFQFQDIENRCIKFYMEEVSNRKTVPMNLLAPIGYESKNPNFLPIFFMYNFDFLRRGKTKISCMIDDREIKVDKFPVPMNMQFRYFIRYSNCCQLFEFGNTDSNKLLEVELVNNTYRDKNVEYVYDGDNSLEKITLYLEDGNININFSPSFDMNKDTSGTFKILPKEEMGYIEGVYEVKKDNDKLSIELAPNVGWVAVPNSFITRMILKPNSIFCSWCRGYQYTSEIDTSKKLIKSNWKNNNAKEN